MKKVTMQTIAEQLGVSKALVSKALSNDPAVSDATRENIWRTAERLGYRVRAPKKSPLAAEGGQLAALMPNAYLTDFEYWGELIRGIHDEAARCGCHLVLAGVDVDSPPSEGLPAVIRDGHVDGVIALGHLPPEYLAMLQAKRLPFAIADGNLAGDGADHVLANNFWGAKQAVLRLLEAGHRRLVFVGDPESALSFSERKRGFEAAAAEYRASHSEALVEMAHASGMGVSGRGNYITETFAAAVRRQLEGDEPATAFFCANDMVALEILKLFAEWGVNCPQDASVCGFDDLLPAARTRPRLSTVTVPRTELGRKAVQLVLRRIREPEALAELVQLPTSFAERDSIGPPPSGSALPRR